MPIVDLAPRPLNAIVDTPEGGYVTPGAEEIKTGSDTPGLGDAIFRRENMISSALASETMYAPIRDDPDYKPFDQIKGTKYEPYFSRFTDVRNAAQFDAMRRDIDREEQDHKLIAQAPWWQTVPLTLLANVTDPTILAPAGSFVRGTKGGFSIARSAFNMGASTGFATAAQEVALHATQETRTVGESALAIGGSVVLGGLLGAGGAALLSKAEWRSALNTIDHELSTGHHVPGSPPPIIREGSPSPEFHQWFGRSTVRDDLGKPVPVFHGTDVTFEAFDAAKLGHATDAPSAKQAFFFTEDLKLAKSYAEGSNIYEDFAPIKFLNKATFGAYEKFNEALVGMFGVSAKREGKVATAYLRAENPLVVDFKGSPHREESFYDIIVRAKKDGHDGVLFKNAIDPGFIEGLGQAPANIWAVFGSDQIKIARFEKAAEAQVPHGFVEPASAGSAMPNSIGAAAVIAPGAAAHSIAGKVAGTTAAATQRLNPGLRILHSPNPETRDVGLNLFEMSQYLRGNEAGMASPVAVETLRKQWNGGLVDAVRSTAEGFTEYRKAGGALGRTEFQEAVGKAMRRGDEDPIPQVAAVAKEWRAKVFDPLKQAAIDAKLLPADVSVDTAVSYFSRLWNRNKLIGEEGGFKQVVQDYYAKAIGKEYDRASDNHARRLAKLDQEAVDLKLDNATGRVAAIEDVEGKLAAQRRHPQFDNATKLDELQQQLRGARDDPAAAKAIREEIAGLKKAGGDDLKAFTQERADLRQRARNLDLGYAAMRDKSAQVIDAIKSIEEANENSLHRLINKGRQFERDAQRLSPEKFEEKLVDLKNTFADILKREDAAADRMAKLRERVAAGETPDAKILAASEKFDKAHAARSEKLTRLAKRIEEVDAFDPLEALGKVRSAVDDLVAQVSSTALGRGERIARLNERLQSLDPKTIDQRLKDIAARKAELERGFLDRWEIRTQGEGVGSKSADFSQHARDIADHAFNTLTGRVGDGTRPEFITINTRGPMKDRTFNIPDELIERWLEHDVDLVGRRYTRVMSSDVELARKFGSPDMKEALQKVRDGYDQLRAGVTDEKQLLTIAKQERADLRDLEGVRDLIRGTYAQSAWERDFGKIVRVANAAQYILKMGQVVLSSLTEPVRVVAARGLLPFMHDGLAAMANTKAAKLSIKEAELAGNINDKVLAARLSTVADLTDFYGSRGPVEKVMDNLTNVASSWNGIRIWTDGVKMLASTMIQNKVLSVAASFAEAGAKDKRYLAFLGIDQSMAERIGAQFAEHGETVGGVHVAGTANWTDDVARRTYRAALNKDLDSMVVTRGAADLPLFANTPLGRLLFQFNSFNLASHQRVLLRGLQEGHARFLSSVVALSSMGMLQTYIAAIATNRLDKLPSMSENPGWWIAEGLDKSGIFQVPFQVANAMEKLTGLNPIKAPMKFRDEGNAQSDKMRNRNELGAVLGPSAGTIQDIGSVASIPQTLFKGEDITKGQKGAAERILPFNSYYGVRQMLKYIVNPPED